MLPTSYEDESKKRDAVQLDSGGAFKVRPTNVRPGGERHKQGEEGPGQETRQWGQLRASPQNRS